MWQFLVYPMLDGTWKGKPCYKKPRALARARVPPLVNMLCKSDFSNMKRKEKVCRTKTITLLTGFCPPFLVSVLLCVRLQIEFLILLYSRPKVYSGVSRTYHAGYLNPRHRNPDKMSKSRRKQIFPFLGLIHLEALWAEAPKRAIHLRADPLPALHVLARVCWVLGVYWSDVRLEERDQQVFRRILTSTESVEVFRRGRSSLNTALHCNFKQIFMD